MNNSLQNPSWDVLVIGAGAAGLTSAITAARKGAKVLLLDGKEKYGAKILMSGGTRCNVTNVKVEPKDFGSEAPRPLSHVLSAFPPRRTHEFFKELGVELVPEDHGKYFPSTHSGRTILDALVRGSEAAGVCLEVPRRVTDIHREGDYFHVGGEGFSHLSKTVILATGGLSFPQSGSDGAGYAMAKVFGHRIIPTTPALVPLLTHDADWKDLSGLSLPVRLTLFCATPGGFKKEATSEGDFLFTHLGFSGPAALDISRYWIRKHASGEVRLESNFLPRAHEEEVREWLMDVAQKDAKKTFKNVLSAKLPARLGEVLLKKARISQALPMNQLTRVMRETIVKLIFHSPLSVTGALGYEKAEVTAGGVDLDEVDGKTLESKIQPGLFFAGEVLDVDGRIGGFNFQWAWSSGFVSGCGAAAQAGKV